MRSALLLFSCLSLFALAARADAEPIDLTLIGADEASQLPLRKLCELLKQHADELPYANAWFYYSGGKNLRDIQEDAARRADEEGNDLTTYVRKIYGAPIHCIERSSDPAPGAPSSGADPDGQGAPAPRRQVMLSLQYFEYGGSKRFQVAVARQFPGQKHPTPDLSDVPAVEPEDIARALARQYLDLSHLRLPIPELEMVDASGATIQCTASDPSGRSCNFQVKPDVSPYQTLSARVRLRSGGLARASDLAVSTTLTCGDHATALTQLETTQAPGDAERVELEYQFKARTESSCLWRVTTTAPENPGAGHTGTGAGSRQLQPNARELVGGPFPIEQKSLLLSDWGSQIAEDRRVSFFEYNALLSIPLTTNRFSLSRQLKGYRLIARRFILAFVAGAWKTLRATPASATAQERAALAAIIDEYAEELGDGIGISLLSDRRRYTTHHEDDIETHEPICEEIDKRLGQWKKEARVVTEFDTHWYDRCFDELGKLRNTLRSETEPLVRAGLTSASDNAQAIPLGGGTAKDVAVSSQIFGQRIRMPYSLEDRYEIRGIFKDNSRTQPVEWTFDNEEAWVDFNVNPQYQWEKHGPSGSTANGYGVGAGFSLLAGVLHLRGVGGQAHYANRSITSGRLTLAVSVQCSLKRLGEAISPTSFPAQQRCASGIWRYLPDFQVGGGYEFARHSAITSIRSLFRIPLGGLELRPAMGVVVFPDGSYLMIEAGVELAFL